MSSTTADELSSHSASLRAARPRAGLGWFEIIETGCKPQLQPLLRVAPSVVAAVTAHGVGQRVTLHGKVVQPSGEVVVARL